MSELQGLQLSLPEFTRRDAQVVAVTVDPVERNAELAASLGLDYRLAADPTLTAIDAYDLRHQDPGMEHPIARPATFVIDATGVVRWRDLTDNFRLRPHPDAILAALDALGR